jgi:hypothetical protein
MAFYGAPEIVEDDYPTIQQFFEFQDLLEKKAGAAIILPTFFTKIILKSAAQKREALEKKFGQFLKTYKTSQYMDWVKESLKYENITDEQYEELGGILLGILFAGHKNPAISTAQTLLFLLDSPIHTYDIRTHTAYI